VRATLEMIPRRLQTAPVSKPCQSPNRASLSANARAQNPQRWSGNTRNRQPAGPVWLNPENEISVPEIRDAA
jgi:hypothetical protein